MEAIRIAEEINNIPQIINLKINQGLVYQDNKEYGLAIQLFEDVLAIAPQSYKLRALNQIGIIYQDQKKYDQSKTYFQELLSDTPDDHTLHAKAMHNLGEIAAFYNNYEESIRLLKQAVAILENNGDNDNFALFNSYHNLGAYSFVTKQYQQAEEYLLKSIAIVDHAKSNPQSFKVYKTLSDLYYTLDDKDKGKMYQEKYFDISQEYITLQQDIQQKDKEYNFELIANRYFDDVKKQDRMASIMMYSKISSGGLVMLLIVIIAYYQLEKRRLRKSVEKELKTLKLIG